MTEKGEKMSQDYFRSSRRPSVSAGYRVVRTLVRFFFTLLYGKMRAPGADDLPQFGRHASARVP
jgi:hypothetical protein